MDHCSLSVVVPAYNERDYIVPCLEALLRRADEILEIIVVDDNSTDGTADLVRALAAENPIIRLITETEQGLTHARNAGLDECKGDVIGRIDADTRVRPEWPQALKQYFSDDANAEVGGVFGLNNSYDSPFRGIKGWYIERQVRRGKLAGGRYVLNLHGANMAIRRTVWEQVRDQVSNRSDIHEDFDIACCIAKADLRTAHLSEMRVDISPRRALLNPIKYADSFYFGHAVIWLPYRSYDPVRRRFSLRYLFSPIDYRTIPG